MSFRIGSHFEDTKSDGDISHLTLQEIFCGFSLKLPCCSDSVKYPTDIFWMFAKIKKMNLSYHLKYHLT